MLLLLLHGQEVALTNGKFVAEEGTYTINVKVKDEAGNENEASITLTVNAKVVEPGPGPSTPQPNPSVPEEKGCGGSVVASIFGVVALIGATLVIRKKKQD